MAATTWNNSIVQDVRYALRQMRRAPVFACVTVLTLALGVGAAAAIFSVMDAMLVRPLPFDHPERILVTNIRAASGYTQPFSLPDYKDLRDSMPNTLQTLAGYETATVGVQLPGGPESMNAVRTSDNYFQVFGVTPVLGRTFLRGEDEAGRNDIAVLSYEAWRNQFNGDPNIAGKTYGMDGHPTTIVGVMPAGFRFPLETRGAIYTPFHNERKTWATNRGAHWMQSVVRMRPGVTEQQALADLDARTIALAQAYPDTDGGRKAGYKSLARYALGNTRGVLWTLTAAVGALLLIACVNVTGLLLARSVKREREAALRAAIGAGRSRLMRQFLTESLLLGALSALLGVAFGYGLLALMRSYLIASLSRGADVKMNATVLLTSVAIATATAILASLLPAFSMSRLDPNRVLKAGGNAGTQRSQSRLRAGFLVAQVFLSVVLLVLAGLLLRVLQRSYRLELGFDAPHLLTVELNLPVGAYTGRDPIATFYQPLLERLQHSPGVTGAGVINLVPVQIVGSNMEVHIAGQPPYPKDAEMLAEVRLVSEGYFNALGISLRQGRLFRPALDGATERGPNMIVNEAFVHKFLPGAKDVVGAQTDSNGTDVSQRSSIVGVVGNVRQSLSEPPLAELDWLIDSMPMKERLSNLSTMSLVVRSSGDPASLIPVVRNALRQVDPTVPMRDAKTMATVIEDQLVFSRLQSWLFGTFAALAVLLAMAGLYGLVSQEVEAGTRDIGVRMALGATRLHVLRHVLQRVGALVAVGSLLGIGVSLLQRHYFASTVELLPSRDGLLLVALASGMTALGLLAALGPASHAANIQPVEALRTE